MINANNTEDYSELIRELKHSEIIRSETKTLLYLKSKYNDDVDKVHLEAVSDCNFIYTYYTDIYNKLLKNELDVNILYKFLNVLQKIENGDINQHEGSFIVGSVLKELYVDSALKKADKLNGIHDNSNEVTPPKVISWKDYKNIMY